eukprot:gene7430-8252_t
MAEKTVPFEIKILIDGYSYTNDDGDYRATGTSTLIKGNINIVVDTGGPWDREKLLKELVSNNLNPEDIDFVVCTHGHSDHVGNLNLFKNAKHIVGFDINYKDVYFEHDFKNGDAYSIYNDTIQVIPTPGHMHSDVSVLVHKVVDLGTVVICGDLFECEYDEDSWKEVSEWPEEQIKQRQKVLAIADYIIPGHGPMFKVNNKAAI